MLRIGTSGFSFQDWKGAVYPQDIKKQAMFEYYEHKLGFSALEVNFTFYQMPSRRTIEGMEKKTQKDFRFFIKAHKDMTHEIHDKKNQIKNNEEVFKSFLYGIEPMIHSGKLGGILLQFPYSFHNNQENRDYIMKSKKILKNIPTVVEFRNQYWINKATFDFLEDNDLGFCVVDEPKLEGLAPFTPVSTSETGYFRFHGRNKNWFDAPVSQRYDYLYSDKELQEFLPAVKEIEKKTKSTYAFFNNCHLGKAAINAKRFVELVL